MVTSMSRGQGLFLQLMDKDFTKNPPSIQVEIETLLTTFKNDFDTLHDHHIVLKEGPQPIST